MSTLAQAAAQPLLNVRLRASPLPGPQLVRDYLAGAPALAPFYAGFPFDIAAYRRVAQAVQASFSPERLHALLPAITATTAAARGKLARIAAGEGVLVTTGQQAGLFTGPLYTIYKILSAIRLAEQLEHELQMPVAALFWSPADDHDFQEVNHAYLLGPDNELQRLELADDGGPPRSMARRTLGDDIAAVTTALAATLPATEFAQDVLNAVRTEYLPGRTHAAAFEGVIQRIFVDYDLLITSSANATVKELVAPIIKRELESAAAHEAAVRAQTERLLQAGYHEQVTVRAGAANVLYEDEEGRDRLLYEDGTWQLSRSKRSFQKDDLFELLQAYPQRFSPNVLLRPVVAGALFPTVAYLGGPAEISYHAQIGCLFQAHDVVMPLVPPRASIDVVEHKVQKVLDKYGLDVPEVRRPFDELVNQIIREELPATVTSSLERLRRELTSGYAALIDATNEIDPTLRGPLESARNTSHKALADMEKKIVSHLKKRNEIVVEQLRKASLSLYPNGAPQERVLNVLSFLARYGRSFLASAFAAAAIELNRTAPEWRGVECGR